MFPFWKCCYKLSLLRREHSLSVVNGLANSAKIQTYDSERLFQAEIPWQGAINMVKVLPFSFDQYFGLFTILLVEGSSEMGLLRHLSNDVFQSL